MNSVLSFVLRLGSWTLDSRHLESKEDADWMLKQDTKIEDHTQMYKMTDVGFFLICFGICSIEIIF